MKAFAEQGPLADQAGSSGSPGKSLIVICTYNEMGNLPRLCAALRTNLPGTDLLVVDDGSPDGTGDWAREESRKQPFLHCLLRDRKQGLGAATVAGMQWGLERNYRWLATMDADFSHAPDEMPGLFRVMSAANGNHHPAVVIGSRYVRGGRIEGWPLTRRLASKTMNLAARWLLGLPARDCSTAMRVYSAEWLGKVDPARLQNSGFGYLEELLFRIFRAGGAIIEVPATFRDRSECKSKATWREGWNALHSIWTLRSSTGVRTPSDRAN